MESLRDTAVLTLASEKLDDARDRHRRQQADELVNKYARRAVSAHWPRWPPARTW